MKNWRNLKKKKADEFWKKKNYIQIFQKFKKKFIRI